MKASEYLIELDFIMSWIDYEDENVKFHCPDNSLNDKDTTNKINKLDNRFIDKEELKDKIQDIDIWHKNGLQLKKEILEMLK